MTPKASKLPKPSPRASKAAAAAAAFAEEAGAAGVSSPSHVQRLKAKNASLKATVAALQKQLANGGGAAPKEGVGFAFSAMKALMSRRQSTNGSTVSSCSIPRF